MALKKMGVVENYEVLSKIPHQIFYFYLYRKSETSRF